MMRKTNKADLAKKIESVVDELNFLSDTVPTAHIIDAMAFLQGLNESRFGTFEDLANLVLSRCQFIPWPTWYSESCSCV